MYTAMYCKCIVFICAAHGIFSQLYIYIFLFVYFVGKDTKLDICHLDTRQRDYKDVKLISSIKLPIYLCVLEVLVVFS